MHKVQIGNLCPVPKSYRCNSILWLSINTKEVNKYHYHCQLIHYISIISRGEYKNWTFWLVEKLIIWCYIHPARAWLLSSPSLPSQQVNMADSCWMKFSIIRKTSLQVQNIWQDGEFSKWLLSPLDQKSFQELVLKAFRNRKRSGCINRQQVRWIDQNLFFFKLNKLLIFRRWINNCEWSQQW